MIPDNDCGYYYLASPYINYVHGRHLAHYDACRVAAELLSIGIVTYCPVAHMHHVSEHKDLCLMESSWWVRVQDVFLMKSEGLIIAKLDGWHDSDGIVAERARAIDLGLSIFYYPDPFGRLIKYERKRSNHSDELMVKPGLRT